MKVVRIALATTMALGGCQIFPDLPRSSDAVKDAAAAIQIADKACDAPKEMGGTWNARLRDEIWDVWYHVHGDTVSCEARRVRIFASNGNVDDCETCVVAD